jgi:hypothetical protein
MHHLRHKKQEKNPLPPSLGVRGDNITRDELEAVDVEFEKLTLEEKKMALCALVDKNKLYVNLSDIDDKAYNISDKDRKFTESFYKREV